MGPVRPVPPDGPVPSGWRCRGWTPDGREVEGWGRTPVEAAAEVDRKVAELVSAGGAK